MVNGSESIIFILINSVTLGKKSPWFVFELVILMKPFFFNSSRKVLATAIGKRLVKKINKQKFEFDGFSEALFSTIATCVPYMLIL